MADSDVLDQKEIDSLISSLSSGEVNADEIREEEEERVKNYDFRRPNKLSKEQMRTLEMIHENLARILTTILSTKLRSVVNFEVVSIEQLSYEEFIRSLPDPTILGICGMPPLEGQFIFEINPDIGYTIIDRLFGGMGKSLGRNRTYTDIERVVLKKVLKWLLSGLPEVWENIIELEPELIEIESNPQFTQIVPSNDMIIVISMNAEIAGSEGLVNIGIPYIVLEPIVQNLRAQQWFAKSRKEQTAEHIKRLKKRIKNAKLKLFAELGKTQLTVSEFLNMEVGDVVKLEKKTDGEIDIKVEDKVKFKGIAGNINRKRAVKITDQVEDDIYEEEFEQDKPGEGELS